MFCDNTVVFTRLKVIFDLIFHHIHIYEIDFVLLNEVAESCCSPRYNFLSISYRSINTTSISNQ